ncbi:MAG: Nitroreductase [Ignavibacteria bacterium]|nr:Nitroreductase [Ignavibacteria bacterium]
MKKKYVVITLIALMGAGIGGAFMLLEPKGDKSKPYKPNNENIKLPEPKYDGNTSVEQALLKRRSDREYKDESLTLTEISQLLWAGQGITDTRGFRTAPSAGALYPLELYVVAGKVNNLPDGIYKYEPQKHELVMVIEGDKRSELCNAALDQPSVKEAAAVIVFSAVYERTTGKYGERGIRYVHIEVGHAAQNIFLQAVSLNLGAMVIGAFDDEEVKKIMNIPEREQPLYILPVGK